MRPLYDPTRDTKIVGATRRVTNLERRPPPASNGGLDLAYEYEWGIDDATLGFIAYGDDGTPATNQCMDGASVAVLQGQGVVTPPAAGIAALSPAGSFISGHCSYRVTDSVVFSAATEIALFPTWVSDAAGNGPYIDWPNTQVPPGQAAKVGQGTVWRFSTTGQGFPFDLWSAGHGSMLCRMVADGSTITATNPFTFADGDAIQAFWTCFVHGWD